MNRAPLLAFPVSRVTIAVCHHPLIQTRCPTADLTSLAQIHPVLARAYAARVQGARKLEFTWEVLLSPARLTDLSRVTDRIFTIGMPVLKSQQKAPPSRALAPLC